MRPLLFILFILFLLPSTLDAADATEVWIGWKCQLSGQPCSTKTDVEEQGGNFAACLMAAHGLEVKVGRWKNVPIVLDRDMTL